MYTFFLAIIKKHSHHINHVTNQNTLKLKTDYIYYYQVIGQLNVTRRRVLFFTTIFIFH